MWVVSDLLRQLPSTYELPVDAWSIECRNLAGPTGRDWTCIERYVVYRCHACRSFFEFQYVSRTTVGSTVLICNHCNAWRTR